MPAGHRSVFIGGADELQLEEGGKVFHPGDVVTMPDLQRASLTASGHRFGAVPDEPDPEPVPEPPPPLESAEISKAVMPLKKTAPTKEAT